MKAKELNIAAHLQFEEEAKGFFRFPVSNAIRLSFWLPQAKGSTFSELSCSEPMEIGNKYSVDLKLIENEILINEIREGIEFCLGVYPIAIAKGKVIAII